MTHTERVRQIRREIALVTVTETCERIAKLEELAKGLLSSHDHMCTQRGNCFGCMFFDTGRFADICPYVKLSARARKELGIEVDE